MSSFLIFVRGQDSASGLTKSWDVCPKASIDTPLGQIRWYAPWRRYVYYPKSETLYDAACLRDITEFLEREMRERKNG